MSDLPFTGSPLHEEQHLFLNEAKSFASEFIARVDEWAPPDGLPRPRIYASSEDRDRVIDLMETHTELFGYLKNRFGKPEDLAGPEAAFAYWLNGSEGDLSRCVTEVEKTLAMEDWVHEAHHPLKVDLEVARKARELAEVLDFAGSGLDAELRSTIADALVERALDPFLEITTTRSEWWTWGRNNWRSVICSEMGIAAIALLGEYERVKEVLSQSVRGVTAILEMGGCDGGYYEGPSYWAYGIGMAVRLADVLHRVSGGEIDLFQHPFLKLTGEFGLHITTPEGGCFDYSDAGNNAANSTVMARLARAAQNPHWQWHVGRHPPEDFYGLLWFDPDLEATEPTETAKYFRGIDVAVHRSSWESDALFVGLKSGWATGSHCDLDINSVIVNSFGKRLLTEEGGWQYAHFEHFFDYHLGRWRFDGNNTFGHNCLIIDGEGQRYSAPPPGERYGWERTGRIVRFHQQPDFTFVVSDGTLAYSDRLHHYSRYLAIVRNEYLVIVDDIEATSPARIECLWHYEGECGELDDRVAEIKNGPASLQIHIADSEHFTDLNITDSRRRTSFLSHGNRVNAERNFISVSPMGRLSSVPLVTILVPHKTKGTRPAISASASRLEQHGQLVRSLELDVDIGGRKDQIVFDMTYFHQTWNVFLR